ncbi:hypothetical protein HBI59_246360 [Parastagonospora nodorum]|nr:hypothetical protein HBI59_246360 [Parastagonospora nodorum]
MTDSLRVRTPINLSAVLYEQSAARPSLSAEVSNMDLNFVLGVAFISDVHMADSLRARTLINLSAVLYEQAAARTGLPAEVGNIDLDFVLSVAFIPDVYMADSLRARTLINLSAVLYEQAAARTGLPAEVGNISSISPRARTLINPSAVLYEQADARSGLSAEVGIMDLDFVPGVAFDAMGNVELTGDLLGDADRVNNNNNNVALTLQFSSTALLNPRSLASKRPALSGSDLDRGRTDPTIAGQISLVEQLHNLVGDNMEELICVGKVKHTYVQAYTVPYPDPKKYLGNSGQQGRIKVLFRRAGNNRNNLNIMVTDPTSREFGRLYCKRKWAHDIGKFHKGKNIQLLRPVFELQRYDYYNLQDGDSLTRIQAIDPSFQTDQFTQQGLISREPGSIYVLRSVDEIQADVADVFDTVVSKSDEVPTRELSSHIKTELAEEHDQRKDTLWALRLCDNSQRALLILFMT